jgi:hypothetical protein
MELLVRGIFWRGAEGYVAEIPSLRLMTSGAAIDDCLNSMKSLLKNILLNLELSIPLN